VVLYEALGLVAPSPVVELNRAVAVAMASGPARALAIVDELIALDRLPGSHLVPTVCGELLARLGRRPEARAELELAARLCANQRERSNPGWPSWRSQPSAAALRSSTVVQLRHDTEGRAYYRRKLAAGKTPMEACAL
jgi:hypothetical protein